MKRAFLALCCLCACEPVAPCRTPYVIAHRGNNASHPENTLGAFHSAAARGADLLELDVHQSLDGVPVVIHDPTLDRTTNGTGPVAAQTAAALVQLDAGSLFSPVFQDERLPTLNELFTDLAGRDVMYSVEIEAGVGNIPYPGFPAQVLAVIDAHGLRSRVFINTYYEEVVRDLQRLAPELTIAFDPDEADYQANTTPDYLPRVAFETGSHILSLDHRYITPELMEAAAARHLEVWAWTVHDRARMRELSEMGVAGIMSGYTSRLRDVVDETCREPR